MTTVRFEFFYERLFAELNSKSIGYAVVRNYEQLPKSKPGKDVDILIRRRDLTVIRRVISDILRESSGEIILSARHFYVSKFIILGVQDLPISAHKTELDLIDKLAWKGLTWLDEDLVIDKSIFNKEKIKVPLAHHELQMMLFHSLLFGGFVNNKYIDKMEKLFLQSDKSILFHELDFVFGDEVARFIISTFESRQLLTLGESIVVSRIRKSLIIHAFRRSFAQASFAVICHYFYEVNLRLASRLPSWTA